jgi:UDP-glucuronate 4-epimerase
MKTILLTGGAGFIGSHLAKALLARGDYRVICFDSLDDFYSPEIKKENLSGLIGDPSFRFVQADIAGMSLDGWREACVGEDVSAIIHLAAKAGVRPSLSNPADYYRTNVTGTLSLLEFARHAGVTRFIFASSSSVYGDNEHAPWKESEKDLHPISPYASSKMAAEQLGQVYAHLYPIQFLALRLFTVYGPRQRPDLAIHKFHDLMSRGSQVTLYGDGSTSRDYTFVHDVVNAFLLALDYKGTERYRTFNIGSGRPVSLLELVRQLEESMQIKADIRFTEEQPGDVKRTWADIRLASGQLGYQPKTSFREGIEAFLQWKALTTMTTC